MKKTLLITLDYPPMIGGVAHYYKNIVEHLPQSSIWVLDNEKGELLSTSSWLWPKWLKGLWSSFRAVRLYSIQHILVGQILPIGTIALILFKVCKIPYTVMTHAMDVTVPFSTTGSPRKQRLIRKILHNAYRVTTVSSFTRKELTKLGTPEKKIVMIYPCPHVDGTSENIKTVHAEKFDRVESFEFIKDKTVLLSVGRLVKRKGFDLVINAFAHIAKEYPECVYVIIGEGSFGKKLQTSAKKSGVGDRIFFLGTVSDEELAQWYMRSTLFIMPSRELKNREVEGFGITYLEANSFGKPVIAGDSGGVSDAVIDGKTGFLIDPNDVPMLVKSIKQLLDNPTQAVMLGEKGRKRVREVFQWNSQAKHLEEILQ